MLELLPSHCHLSLDFLYLEWNACFVNIQPCLCGLYIRGKMSLWGAELLTTQSQCSSNVFWLIFARYLNFVIHSNFEVTSQHRLSRRWWSYSLSVVAQSRTLVGWLRLKYPLQNAHLLWHRLNMLLIPIPTISRFSYRDVPFLPRRLASPRLAVRKSVPAIVGVQHDDNCAKKQPIGSTSSGFRPSHLLAGLLYQGWNRPTAKRQPPRSSMRSLGRLGSDHEPQ